MRPSHQFLRRRMGFALQHVFAAATFLMLSAGMALAEPVPNHLLNFTQSLIGQIGEQEFAKLPPSTREAVRAAIAKAPLRS